MDFHNGSIQVLPSYWAIPIMIIMQLVDNWFMGNSKHMIPPLDLPQNHHVDRIITEKNTRARKTPLQKNKFVMKGKKNMGNKAVGIIKIDMGCCMHIHNVRENWRGTQ